MAGVLQPLDELTEENTGPAVIIVIYSLASVTIGVTVIRFWLQRSRGIPFCLDDGAYVVANVRVLPSFKTETSSTDSALSALGRYQYSIMDSSCPFWPGTAFGDSQCQ